jgi:hypothetical protein
MEVGLIFILLYNAQLNQLVHEVNNGLE